MPEEVDLATPMIAALTEDRRKLEIRMWIAVAIAVLALLVSVGLLVRWRQYKPILDEQAAESAAEAQREAPVPSTGPTNVDLPAIDLGDGVSIAMVRIPPGTFLMGSPTGDRDERPPHRVKITRGFSISMFEITQAQWSRLMPSNPSPESGPESADR